MREGAADATNILSSTRARKLSPEALVRSAIGFDGCRVAECPFAVVNIAQLRTEYKRATLDESQVDADPFRQFSRWFDEAIEARLPEVNAMTSRL